jgi:hypothetical protein
VFAPNNPVPPVGVDAGAAVPEPNRPPAGLACCPKRLVPLLPAAALFVLPNRPPPVDVFAAGWVFAAAPNAPNGEAVLVDAAWLAACQLEPSCHNSLLPNREVVGCACACGCAGAPGSLAAVHGLI